MRTLFLDFCSHQKTMAIVEDGETLTLQQIEDHTDESKIMPLIEDMLARTRKTPHRKIRSSATEPTKNFHALNRIAAVTGPGGFMSQRVGLSIANALAWSLKIPLGGLHLSDLYAARVSGDALWIHSTKKQLLFIRGLGTYAKQWPEPVTISLDDLQKLTDGTYIGEVLPEQAAVLRIKPYPMMKDLADILPKLVESVSYADTPLLPWYGRGA